VRLEHYCGDLAACSGGTVAARWVEVVAVEASASGGSGVALKSSVMASKTEGAAPTLASVAGSSMVICKIGCYNRSELVSSSAVVTTLTLRI
jgi:hypothetical protein